MQTPVLRSDIRGFDVEARHVDERVEAVGGHHPDHDLPDGARQLAPARQSLRYPRQVEQQHERGQQHTDQEGRPGRDREQAIG